VLYHIQHCPHMGLNNMSSMGSHYAQGAVKIKMNQYVIVRYQKHTVTKFENIQA